MIKSQYYKSLGMMRLHVHMYMYIHVIYIYMEKHVYSILAKKDSHERKERNQEPNKFPTQNTYTP